MRAIHDRVLPAHPATLALRASAAEAKLAELTEELDDLERTTARKLADLRELAYGAGEPHKTRLDAKASGVQLILDDLRAMRSRLDS